MPSLITHSLAAKNILKQTNNSLTTVINSNIKSFLLGSNGPDLFYFYHTFPWSSKINKNEVYDIGTYFHFQNINRAFQLALERTKKLNNDTVTSYMAGWLCHYALDRNCHPFIFHFAGPTGESHRRLEATIDSYILDYVLHTDIKTFKPYELLSYTKEDIQAIYDLYSDIVLKLCHFSLTSEIISDSLRDLKQTYSLLHDPYNIKIKAIQLIEKVPYSLTGTIIPCHPNRHYDVMNIKHNEWVNPVDNTMISTDDFYSLFHNGIQDGAQLLQLFANYMNGTDTIESILDYIDNRDYCSGLHTDKEMLYYHPIFDKEE